VRTLVLSKLVSYLLFSKLLFVILLCVASASFSSVVVGKVQHGKLSKYFFDDLQAAFPPGKVVTAKILRSVVSCAAVLPLTFLKINPDSLLEKKLKWWIKPRATKTSENYTSILRYKIQ